jgi:histidine triad (HIT) family protein
VFRHAPPDYDCPVCALVRGEDRPPWSVQADVVWRDGTTTAWINPRWWAKNPGNVLVAPDRHVENLYELDRDLAGAVHETARRVALAMKSAYDCEGISTRQHNEPAGDQEVWHYHLHVFPRYTGDELYRSPFRRVPPQERRAYAERLRAAIRWS